MSDDVRSSVDDGWTVVPGCTEMSGETVVDRIADVEGGTSPLLPRDLYMYSAHVGSCE